MKIDQEKTVLGSFDHTVWYYETYEIKGVPGGLEVSKSACAG